MTSREVELSGGAPWGFRMHGGADQNQPLRISRVNPGRKASLSGIREGDVISSINGQSTKGMSNADAHAMLRSAGPVLRLGLNEDREMSPRRRSIGKASELKRPSQIINEVNSGRATPQPPAYATIRPSQSPHNRTFSSPMRSLNTVQTTLSSTPLVKSIAPTEEPLKFHPTNPFYTTLPSNYSSASKLPVPNGRATLAGVDRYKPINKSKDSPSFEDLNSEMQPPVYSTPFNPIYKISGNYNDTQNSSGYDSTISKYDSNSKTETYFNDSNSKYLSPGSVPNDVIQNGKNPFETKRNSDPFEKYLENKVNGTSVHDSKKIFNSKSDSDFHSHEEITKHSTITEHKISEIEEVKTIKKIVMNGSSNDLSENTSSEKFNSGMTFSSTGDRASQNKELPKKEHNIKIDLSLNERGIPTPTQSQSHYFDTFDGKDNNRQRFSTSSTHHSLREDCNNFPRVGETQPSEVVVTKPPARSPSTPASKRDSTEHKTSDVKTDPLTLKDLCVKKIASFPFGNKILEELAHVSERLQSMSILALQSKGASEFLKDKEIQKPTSEILKTKMPYFPLPDLSTIEQVTLSTSKQEHGPPPVQPRNSSLRKSQEEQQWTAIPTTKEPLYVCLSPSQKMLMEKTNTIIKKEVANQLLDSHEKFVDRRGYNEKFNENLDTTPIVPFKSQTGSRLLALIRDPSVTNNVSLSTSHKSIFKSVESLPKLNYFDKREHFERRSSTSNSIPNSKLFKPIPPPRPKKFSTSVYESDENSDFTDNSFSSMRNEKKVFHYSTGNLNKEIEHDISTIQNMHRYYSHKRDVYNEQEYPRRPSLPKDLCEQQMEYIRQKEKEVEEEIYRLEQDKSKYPERKGPRAPVLSAEPQAKKELSDSRNYVHLKRDSLFSDTKNRKEDKGKLSSVFSKSQEELLREKMYSEYVCQMAEREQRRQQKLIKISHTRGSTNAHSISKSMPDLDNLESKIYNRIEKEFISKARERWHKLGFEDPETEYEKDLNSDIYREPKVIEHKIKVIQAGEEKDVTKLPSHIQEFVNFTAKRKEDDRNGESEPEREPAHVVVFCAVIILFVVVGRFVLRLLRYY